MATDTQQGFDTIVRVTFIDDEYPVLYWAVIPCSIVDDKKVFYYQDDEHYLLLKPGGYLLVLPKLNVRYFEFKPYNSEIHKHLQNEWG